LCYAGGPLILALWPCRIMHCNQCYSGLYPTATTPDPRSIDDMQVANLPESAMDQGSVLVHNTKTSSRWCDVLQPEVVPDLSTSTININDDRD